MAVELYRRTSADMDPERRLDYNPIGGQPRPTGYYPDMYGSRQMRATVYPVEPYGVNVLRRQVGDVAVMNDQHPYLQVDATWWPAPAAGRRDGAHDPLTDGPARPTVRNLQLFYMRAQGSSDTRFLDVPDGRRFSPYGTQDGVTTAYYQDPVAQMTPADAAGLAPDSLKQLPPGPPHGWTSIPAVNATAFNVHKSRVLQQQTNPHQDRLANATASGQTYSQRTAHVQRTAGATPSWRPRG